VRTPYEADDGSFFERDIDLAVFEVLNVWLRGGGKLDSQEARLEIATATVDQVMCCSGMR
jgi:hypothetical protein